MSANEPIQAPCKGKRESKLKSIRLVYKEDNESLYDRFRSFAKSCNVGRKRSKQISDMVIIDYLIRNASNKDVANIRDESLSIEDRIYFTYEKHISDTNEKISFHEYLARKLKIKIPNETQTKEL